MARRVPVPNRIDAPLARVNSFTIDLLLIVVCATSYETKAITRMNPKTNREIACDEKSDGLISGAYCPYPAVRVVKSVTCLRVAMRSKY